MHEHHREPIDRGMTEPHAHALQYEHRKRFVMQARACAIHLARNGATVQGCDVEREMERRGMFDGFEKVDRRFLAQAFKFKGSDRVWTIHEWRMTKGNRARNSNGKMAPAWRLVCDVETAAEIAKRAVPKRKPGER